MTVVGSSVIRWTISGQNFGLHSGGHPLSDDATVGFYSFLPLVDDGGGVHRHQKGVTTQASLLTVPSIPGYSPATRSGI